MRGRFITFEGGEGVGKSTQIARLAARLEKAGIATVVTREPGGSPRAEALRGVLLSGDAKPYGALAETILIASARADHVDVAIRPALDDGRWVLCDRFIDSTRAYQGALGAVDGETLTSLEKVAANDCMPDVTLMLDAPAQLGMKRARKRAGKGAKADRFEAEGAAFHDRLRVAFIDIARMEPERCLLIDATGSADEVEGRIWEAIERRYDLRPAIDPEQET